jgi:hypothetical protein
LLVGEYGYALSSKNSALILYSSCKP